MGEAAATDEACVPVTCGQLGRMCGASSDGCGGTVSCGVCGDGACNEVGFCCGGNNGADPCGPALHAGGAVDFAVITSGSESDGFTAVDADLMGNLFVLKQLGPTMFLEKYVGIGNKAAQADFSVDLKAYASGISVAPTLDQIVISAEPSTASLFEGSTERSFTKDGASAGTGRSFLREARRSLLAMSYQGSKAFADSEGRLIVRDSADRVYFEMEELPVRIFDSAFDIDENIIAVGETSANFVWRGMSFNIGTPFVVKYSKLGAVLWAKSMNVAGVAREIGMTSNGFAVVSGTFMGGFSFAEEVLESRSAAAGFVLGFNPDGTERYGYSPGIVNEWPRVAMDQTGVAFIAYDRPSCGPMEVQAMTFKGELAWRKVFENTNCTLEGRVNGLAAVRGVPVLAGRFTGTMTNLDAPQSADLSSSHGFLIKFKP